MTTDPQHVPPRRLFRPLGRLAALAGLVASLAACGGGSDGPGPFDELLFVTDNLTVTSYSVSSGGTPTRRDSAMIPGIPGTYSRTGDTVTVTIVDHNVPDGYWVYMDFGPGAGGTAADGMYVATDVDDDNFTVTTTASGTITNGTCLRSPAIQEDATYVQAGTTITVTLPDHGLSTSDGVSLFFDTGAAQDINREIATIPDTDTFTVEVNDPLNTSGDVTVVVGANYTIFGMAMHPNGRWLYVTSTYDCYEGDPYCWGNDLISRFSINWDNGRLEFEESYRTDPSGDIDDAAPVTLVFSPDGTRMINQCDDLDGLRLWDVDTVTGDIVQVANSGPGTTGQHGVAWAANGSRAYHGTRVYTVGANTLTYGGTGERGESNQIIGNTMFGIFSGQNGIIRALSLADPDAPALIAASAPTPNHARDLALLDGGALIVAAGWGGLKCYDYDGATILDSVGVGDTEFRDGGAPFPADPGDELGRAYRTISANAAEDIVASAYFTFDPDASSGGQAPSGFALFRVAADGTLTLLGDYPGSNYARVARFFQKP